LSLYKDRSLLSAENFSSFTQVSGMGPLPLACFLSHSHCHCWSPLKTFPSSLPVGRESVRDISSPPKSFQRTCGPPFFLTPEVSVKKPEEMFDLPPMPWSAVEDVINSSNILSLQLSLRPPSLSSRGFVGSHIILPGEAPRWQTMQTAISSSGLFFPRTNGFLFLSCLKEVFFSLLICSSHPSDGACTLQFAAYLFYTSKKR